MIRGEKTKRGSIFVVFVLIPKISVALLPVLGVDIKYSTVRSDQHKQRFNVKGFVTVTRTRECVDSFIYCSPVGQQQREDCLPQAI